MKRVLTIITLMTIIGLAGALALATAQSQDSPPDHPVERARAEQSPMPSCPMMMKGMMRNRPMRNTHHMGSMCSSMMKEHSMMTGQCMQVMMSDENRRAAMIEMFKRNPQLRERMKQILQEAEQ